MPFSIGACAVFCLDLSISFGAFAQEIEVNAARLQEKMQFCFILMPESPIHLEDREAGDFFKAESLVAVTIFFNKILSKETLFMNVSLISPVLVIPEANIMV